MVIDKFLLIKNINLLSYIYIIGTNIQVYTIIKKYS